MSEILSDIKNFEEEGVIDVFHFDKYKTFDIKCLDDVDSDDHFYIVNNITSLVMNLENEIICRGMPKMMEYQTLSRSQRAEFLSDKITMIEYIKGDDVYIGINGENIFVHTKSIKAKQIIEGIPNFEKMIKSFARPLVSKKDKNYSIALKVTKGNELYIEGVMTNEMIPSYLEDKVIDMVICNLSSLSGNIFKRPMHYTTSLNESEHRPNTEWIMRSNNNFCLLLNKFKK